MSRIKRRVIIRKPCPASSALVPSFDRKDRRAVHSMKTPSSGLFPETHRKKLVFKLSKLKYASNEEGFHEAQNC